MKLNKNKKGYFRFILVLIVVLAAISIVGVISYNLHNEWNTEVQSNDMFPNVSKTEAANLNNSMPGVMDFFTLTIYMVLVIGGIVTAYFSEANPIMLGVAVLIILSILMIPMLLSNMWEEFITDNEFIDLRSDFPITDFIMSYYAHLFIGVIFLASMAAFVRRFG